MSEVRGHLAHEKHPPPRTLQLDYAQGPMVVLRGSAVSHGRGTPLPLYLANKEPPPPEDLRKLTPRSKSVERRVQGYRLYALRHSPTVGP